MKIQTGILFSLLCAMPGITGEETIHHSELKPPFDGCAGGMLYIYGLKFKV